jgi:predicted transcriptional regulator
VPAYRKKTKYIVIEEFMPTEVDKRILLQLAKERGLTKYALKNKLKLQHSTVYGSVNRLKKEGMVEVIKAERFRTGLEKQTYGLTIKGIAYALLFPEAEEDIEKIAKANAEVLPLVLGKWQHFKREGVEAIAFRSLQITCGVMKWRTWEWLPLPPEVQEFQKEISDQERFTSTFLCEPIFHSSKYPAEEVDRWVKCCAKDPKLYKYLYPLLQALEMSAKKYADMVSEWYKVLPRELDSKGEEER